MRAVEFDALKLISKSLFAVSRNRFLDTMYFPELTNQLQQLLNRNKIRGQLFIANKEKDDRAKKSRKETAVTSFSDMSGHELQLWIDEATHSLNKPYEKSRIITNLSHQKDLIALPPYSAVKYSFLSYHDTQSARTKKLVEKGIQISRHPSHVSCMAKIGGSLPLKVSMRMHEKEIPLHSSDTIRDTHSKTNHMISEFLAFLSYGTFCPINQSKTLVVQDKSCQTESDFFPSLNDNTDDNSMCTQEC